MTRKGVNIVCSFELKYGFKKYDPAFPKNH